MSFKFAELLSHKSFMELVKGKLAEDPFVTYKKQFAKNVYKELSQKGSWGITVKKEEALHAQLQADE